MPETPQSHYQLGTWTVTKLKDELRSRNLSPAGSKTELIARLEHNDSQVITTPKETRGRKKTIKSPSKVSSNRSVSPSPIFSSPVKMSVNQLKDELKSLGLSPIGKKSELMHRLQEAQTVTTNPVIAQEKNTPISSPSQVTHHQSPRKSLNSPKKPIITNLVKAEKFMNANDIGLLVSPITTIFLALRCGWTIGLGSRSLVFWLNLIALGMLVLGVNLIEGPHQVYLGPIWEVGMWYGRWIVLGILSSIGLGTGAHTFLLFLGPFIARATTAAYVCKTVDFSLRGENSLLCPISSYERVSITLWMILDKVKWEAFSWGLGTAIGELPPYIIARASAIAGKSSGEIREVKQIAAKKRQLRTWGETLQLASYSVVSRLGFFGILLCASIPNPLFDVAGITCGYFMVPFFTFASATFLGKAIIKASIQAAFVVFLFSRDYLEQAISTVNKQFPSLGKPFHEWVLAQRVVFQERRPNPVMETIGSAWHGILILMMLYFILSVVRSAAILQARREGLIKDL